MPFAGYKDFADCVSKNGDQDDPEAYCAAIMKKAEKPAKESVLAYEVIDASEATFHKDEETGKMTADVVIIRAGRAKNPRNYRPAALQRAAKEGIYNGLRMFVNHSTKPPLSRDFGEMVSAVESTQWDPKRQAITGKVEFFDENFFNRAQAAKKYIGISADHRIAVNNIQEGRQRIQDVVRIVGARSVDWVLYPSAGGEILSFAKESEGVDQVEWSDITLDQLRENAPELVTALEAELAASHESDGSKDDDDQGKAPVVTPEQIQQMIADGVRQGLASAQESESKRAETIKKVREQVSKSGLHSRIQARIVNAFEGQESYDQKAVDSMITDAKEELKELGFGPKITGMGPTTGSAGSADGGAHQVTVKESVEDFFGVKKATNSGSKES